MLVAKEYTANVKAMSKYDGIKALVLYCICIAILFLQGQVYRTNLSVNILNTLQLIFPLIPLALVLIFILLAKQKFASIGLTSKRVKQSLLLGLVLSILFVAGIISYISIVENTSVRLQFPSLTVFIIFIVGALQEEIFFRGYIQTRLAGLIKSSIVCSILTAFLFLLVHYPVRWVVAGFSLSALPPFYVACLLILHFLCACVYKKTNCLWGAVILHLLYNLGQSMLIS